jgi:hypothetical protein
MTPVSVPSDLPALSPAELAAVIGWDVGRAVRKLAEHDILTLAGLCEEFCRARKEWTWQEGHVVASALALALVREEPVAWLRSAVLTLASKRGDMHTDRVEGYLAVVCCRRRELW